MPIDCRMAAQAWTTATTVTIEGEFYPSRYPDEGEHYSSYRIEALIEEDPSGRVYRAMDSNFSRPVRLKVFSDPISQVSSFIDILRIQMQAAAGLNLTGLTELYELGQQGNQVFLATEWGKGAWISRLLIHRGKFPLEEAINLMTKCAEVLQAISNNHIFHGNLKTSNLMLLTTGDVKIADAGFASAARTAFGPTNLATYLGTANFLAPEMVEAGAADFRADIYSLGMIFYYLLFQAVPFRYDGQKLTLQSDEPNSPIYTDVLDVISRMTERNPQKRYQNYENLIEHLQHLRLIHMQVVKIPAVANLWGAGIKTQNLFKLLCAVFVSGISGVLTVTREEVQRKFYLRNRQLVFFESNQPGDGIWNWLVKKKEIDAQNKPDDGDDFQIALNRIIAKQFIRLEDFKFRYEELMNRVLADVLKWTGSVDVEFANADIHNEPLATLSLGETLLRAARQTIDFREVKRELRYDSLLRRTALFQTLIPEFQLNMEERSVAALTQDALHVGGLMKNPDADEKPLRFLYLLAQIGTLEVGSLTGSGRFDASDFVKEPLLTPQGDLPPLDPPFEDWDGPMEEDFSNPDDPVRPEVQRTISQISVERLDAEAESRFQMAQDNYDNGQFWQAARYCELALGIHEDARYYLLMGHSYAHHPKFRNKAEDCFHKAIHLDPLNVQIHLELAKFYMDVGLLLRAKTHYEKALSIVNDIPEATEALHGLNVMELGVGGCPCEHKPGCHHVDGKHHHHD
jgi:serine/threonine protein kinase/tetratricopeptide (TPR) repeat protein